MRLPSSLPSRFPDEAKSFQRPMDHVCCAINLTSLRGKFPPLHLLLNLNIANHCQKTVATAFSYKLPLDKGQPDYVTASRFQYIHISSDGLYNNICTTGLYSRHGLVDGLDPVSEGKLVHQLLGRLLKVDLPALLALGVGQDHVAVVLFAQVVEEVLVQAGVLAVVGGDLAGKGGQAS